MTATFDPSEIPANTVAEIYFVNSEGEFWDQVLATVDANGQATFDTPFLPSDTYTVAAAFEGLEDYGAQTSVAVGGICQ
jgi:hypothetical protein